MVAVSGAAVDEAELEREVRRTHAEFSAAATRLQRVRRPDSKKIAAALYDEAAAAHYKATATRDLFVAQQRKRQAAAAAPISRVVVFELGPEERDREPGWYFTVEARGRLGVREGEHGPFANLWEACQAASSAK